jgi:hypothetical protein
MPRKNRKAKEELSILPSSENDFVEIDAPIECSRTPTGKTYEKHILNKGVLLHPMTGAKINIDDEFVRKLKRNFDNGTCDIVQVPLADGQNAHSEDPDRNIGEVIDIRERDNKIYAVIDARRADAVDKLGKTWLGASAMLSTNYKDTKTGNRVGPTLLHVAVTNRPYVTGLEDYKEIVQASNTGKGSNAAVYLESADNRNDETLAASTPPEEITMNLDELFAALLEHGVDVPALQAAAAEADAKAALSNELADKLAETLELSNSSVDVETVVGAIAELHTEKVELSNRVHNLERAQATHVVKALVKEGYVLPAQEETYVELRLSNTELFEKLVPAEPIIKHNAMVGEEGATDERHSELDLDKEIARLTGRSVEIDAVVAGK